MLSTRLVSPRLLLALTFVALGAFTSACADPSTSFDDFVERSPPPPPPGDCPEAFASPAPGEMDGAYFVTMVTSLANAPGEEKPLTLRGDITTVAQGGGLGLGLALQFFDKADWRTAVGETKTADPVPVGEDGKFTIELKTVVIAKEANCINGLGVTVDVTLMGNVCGVGSFLCGDLTGHVLTTDFTGTFTMQRITDEASYPDALLDCKQTEYTAALCGPM
jgi:hypothetical protein